MYSLDFERIKITIIYNKINNFLMYFLNIFQNQGYIVNRCLNYLIDSLLIEFELIQFKKNLKSFMKIFILLLMILALFIYYLLNILS
jgi:hypothetical protein